MRRCLYLSQEEETEAGAMKNQIDEATKQERYHRLMALQAKISEEIQQEREGKVLTVLVEGHDEKIRTLLWRGPMRKLLILTVRSLLKVLRDFVGDFVNVQIDQGFTYEAVSHLVRSECSVDVEIISTGTELLLGDILNTSFQLLSRTLNDAGFSVLYQSTVGDNQKRLLAALSIAQTRAQIIILTGGLGPTRGDITAQTVADFLGRPLVLSEEWLKKMEAYFASRGLVMSPNNRKQAYVPEGAVIFNNDVGTAPGMAIETNGGKVLILLPGPPEETKFVLENEMMPYLRQKFQSQGIIHSRILHLKGLTESMTAEKLDDIIMAQTNPTVALYARRGEILVRITAKAASLEDCMALIHSEETKIRAKVGEYIYGTDYETWGKHWESCCVLRA